MLNFEDIFKPSPDGRYWGKYQAIVADNNDPEKRGRIRVRQPFFYGNNLSPWALPCVPYGGSNQVGEIFIPEIGSGVWIEFQYGLIDYPIWTGFWYAKPNGISEMPVEAQENPQAKVLKTKKFVIVIDDNKGTLEIKNLTTGKPVIIKADGIDPNGIIQDSQHRFVTDEEKERWDSYGSGTVVEESEINGNIRVDGKEINVYTHPATHPASMITTDSSRMFVSQAEKDTWNSKLSSVPVATSSTIGGIKSGGDITVDANGIVTVKDNSHNHTKSNITDFNHTHQVSEITDFDTAVKNNSDVAANTAARHYHPNKALLDTYTQNDADLRDAVAKKHTQNTDHTLTNTGANTINTTGTGNIVDFKVNGVTKSSIDNAGNFTGNANTASKLKTARNISLSGDVTGSVSFDGSSNVTINTTLSNSGVSAGTYTKITVDSKGRVTSGTTLSASDIPNLDWSKITSGKPTTLSGYGITDGVKNNGATPSIQAGLDASKPTAGTVGRLYIATDTNKIYRDTGSNWQVVSTINWNDIVGKPSSYPPSTHTHAISDVTNLQTTLNSKANISDVLTKNNTTPYTPTASYHPATKKYVDDSIAAAGSGYMLKAIYDTNNDGIVDNADKLDGKHASDFALASHTHTVDAITGNWETTKLTEPSYVTGGVTITSKPLFDVLRADRTAFLPASQIIIEKSTDGGITWEDAGISDTNKARLFTGQRPTIAIPLKDGKKNTDCMLRITITGMKYNVPAGTPETKKYDYWNSNYVTATERYFSAEDAWLWVSSGPDRIYCKVERATGANPNNWVTVREAFLYGWAGGNYIKLDGATFGGGTSQTGNYWNWRFTFRTATTANDFDNSKLNQTYITSAQAIYHIKISGRNVWNSSNNLMYHDHLYTWDENKNAIFPANVTASDFYVGSNKVWHAGNDGNGSGLDADLLDGKHASDFAPSSHTHAGTDITSAVANASNADKVDNYHAGNSSGQVPVSNGVVCSNLNADMLDGKHASDFTPSSHTSQAAAISTLGHVYEAEFTATLTASGWSGSTAPYTQTVTVSGITSSHNPIIDVVMSGTYSTDQQRNDQWGYIYRAVTGTNSITFYASVKPTIDLPIRVKVVA